MAGIDFKSLSNEDLYHMLMRGDNEAWTFLYNMALRMSRWYCGKIKSKTTLPDPEDLASSVCTRLLEKRKSIKSPEAVKSYVWRIVQSSVIDSIRSQKNTVLETDRNPMNNEDEKQGGIGQTEANHEDILFQLQVVEIIKKALLKLPEICRMILTEWMNLKRGKYSDYPELSEALGMPVPTVSSLVTRCARKLAGFKELRDAWEAM